MFKARGKPRRVGREVEKDEPADSEATGPIVKRPGITGTGKKPSKSRLSFGPGQAPEDDLEQGTSGGRGANGLLKAATEKSSLKRSLNPPPGLGGLAFRAGGSEDRPSYSKDYLSELRNSTPTTPSTRSAETSDNEISLGEIIPASKGSQEIAQLEGNNVTHVPSASEIREKKERRARIAKEQEYISLDERADDNEISLLPQKSKPETRLVRDDEDFAEGFDEYVEDGGIAIGRKAQVEQRNKARAEIQEMINNVEDTSDEDDSEAERNRAYDDAQTRAGMDGLARKDQNGKPHAPTIITPIPRLPVVIERLRGLLKEKEAKKALLVKQMEALQKEKAEIAVREIEIQNLITQTGEKYEQLRIEAGIDKDTDMRDTKTEMGRGLEDIGT